MNKQRYINTLYIIALLTAVMNGQLIRENDPALQGIDVIRHLGEEIPLDIPYLDTDSSQVQLSDFFHQGKPVVLSMTYTGCEMLCTLILDGLVNGLNQMDWQPGADFELVNVSIDTTETPVDASGRKALYREKLSRKDSGENWHFLTGERREIDRLAAALGFEYYYEDKLDQYAHPAVIFILTEDGRISRYLFGIEFPGKDLKLSLVEASKLKISNSFNKLLLFCFHYDADAGGYVLMAIQVMKLGGAVTLVILALILGGLWYREKRPTLRRKPTA